MNKLRCRPGDLAVVISAANRVNVGRIVSVVRRVDDESDAHPDHLGKPRWIVKAPATLTWLHGEKKVRRKSGPALDEQLQPIRGYRPREDLVERMQQLQVRVPRQGDALVQADQARLPSSVQTCPQSVQPWVAALRS